MISLLWKRLLGPRLAFCLCDQRLLAFVIVFVLWPTGPYDIETKTLKAGRCFR